VDHDSYLHIIYQQPVVARFSRIARYLLCDTTTTRQSIAEYGTIYRLYGTAVDRHTGMTTASLPATRPGASILPLANCPHLHLLATAHHPYCRHFVSSTILATERQRGAAGGVASPFHHGIHTARPPPGQLLLLRALYADTCQRAGRYSILTVS